MLRTNVLTVNTISHCEHFFFNLISQHNEKSFQYFDLVSQYFYLVSQNNDKPCHYFDIVYTEL